MKKRKQFNRGDKIYTRVVLQGKQVGEFVFDCVEGMTELICALRYRTRQFRGLARIYIRNITSGWSFEQPLMLYPGRYSEAQKTSSASIYPNGDRYAQWMVM
ncbi:MAG: hypothetical protein J6C81_05920 [Muribaculaceae bacterium]|nr:hypothetical protein [Muribaculaceae bacterium]